MKLLPAEIDALKSLVETKYISVQKHPDAELYIYNYTQKCQYERLWNSTTKMCRGLILDNEYNVIARPFPKFFNLEEHKPEEIPNLPFEVFDKLDGSLGILYWLNCRPHIATRGSFTSEQAIRGTKILRKTLENIIFSQDQSVTYLFEIIYPENRIVCDYGKKEELVLLDIISKETGISVRNSYPSNIPPFRSALKLNSELSKDLENLKGLEGDNREGFVVRFSNDFRVKVKFEEYKRLHRIVTQCSNLTIWEHLKDSKPINELIERVPDEFYGWVKHTMDELSKQYNEIESECQLIFSNLDYGRSRREYAEYFNEQSYPGILFRMLDEKDYSADIYKLIKPKFNKPFKIEVE
jgi:RNA ligase